MENKDATPQALEALPGDLPGLLRFCSPVLDAEDVCRIGVVVGTWPNPDVVRVHWTWDDSTEDVPVSRLLLDLSDATGRAHAAWWLATRTRGIAALCEVPTVWSLRASSAYPDLFADLDPDDPRTLPDGFRRVDAEALRRVCLHVAGRKVAP